MGLPRNRIIDGRVFQVPNLDFPRLVNEGVVYGILQKNSFSINNRAIYPQKYGFKGDSSRISLGRKSYIESGCFEGYGIISIGKFSSIAWKLLLNMGHIQDHNYNNVGSYALTHLD